MHLRNKIIAHLKKILVWLPEELEVNLTPYARQMWAECYARWRSETWPDEMFAAIVQRIPDVVLKIALIYAVLEKRKVTPKRC